MNRIRVAVVAVFLGCLLFGLSGCQPEQAKTADFSNAQEVAKLATFECTYHNVVRIERDRDWVLTDHGRKQEWFEYNAVVSFGIDASKVEISAPDRNGVVKISIPKGQVLKDPKIPAESMSDPVDDNGFLTEVTDEDRKKALTKAQQETRERACSDDSMIAAARDSAKTLLEAYVKNVGKTIGEDYRVKWVDAE